MNQTYTYCIGSVTASAVYHSVSFFCTCVHPCSCLSLIICYHVTFHFLAQPTLTLEKDGMSQERPSRPARHPKKKQRVPAEPELSEPDEYVDFTEPRHEPMAEFNAVIVGDETETSSAVQSIQQVNMKISTEVADF